MRIITEKGLERNIGQEAHLGLEGVGVSGFLLKDDNGIYVGVSRGGVKYYVEDGEPIIIKKRVYEINLRES